MMIDTAFPSDQLVDDDIKKMLHKIKPVTRRYVFNADASHKHGRFAGGYVNIEHICQSARYAVKPFPNTYIEVDNRALIRGRGDEPHPDSSERIGFWWTQFGHCFIIEGDERRCLITPFIYAEHGTHDGDHLFQRYVEDPDGSDDAWEPMSYQIFKTLLMCGAVPKAVLEEIQPITRQLTDLYEVGLTKHRLSHDLLQLFFSENIGSFKYAIGALLLLDERSKRRLVPIAASHKIVKGKRKAVPAHMMVTIDLDVPFIRNVYANPIGHRDSPMQHDVSEHWVTYDASTQCQHDWQPFFSEDATKRDLKSGHDKPLRREVCTLCGGRRTRKPNYIAGDAKRGSTVGTKSYRVIASREKGK